jgi:anti-sigma factor RsiW
MICRQFELDIVDDARGVLDPARKDAVTRHLQSCVACRALLDRERAMSAALRRLADEQTAGTLPPSNAQLQNLLASFDVPRQRQRRAKAVLEWTLAASVLIVAGLAAGWKNYSPAAGVSERTAATPAPPTNADSAFVVLPGADALPRFEHGQVIQLDIPSAGGIVRAEVLIGQDGLARAARLVQ